MTLEHITDKKKIQTHLEQDPYLHLYELGDLDDFFWHHTDWYGIQKKGAVQALGLLYSASEIPTFLAFSNNKPVMKKLLSELGQLLPARFYAHLLPGDSQWLMPEFSIETEQRHCKMKLVDLSVVDTIDIQQVEQMSVADATQLQELYDTSYPGNWFEPFMLETNCFFGIRHNGKLIAAAGVHVFSIRFGVAALGNIVTDTDYRGLGYGTAVTAAVCRHLADSGVRIGLNVKKDNRAAVTCYKKLGFSVCAEYDEFTFTKS